MDGPVPSTTPSTTGPESFLNGLKDNVNGLWSVPSLVLLGAGRVNHAGWVAITSGINLFLPEDQQIPPTDLEDDPYRRLASWEPFGTSESGSKLLLRSGYQSLAALVAVPEVALAETLSVAGEVLGAAADVGSQNIQRQRILSDLFGTTVNSFRTFRDRGFGFDPNAPVAEREIAGLMRSALEQFTQGIARPDELKRTIELMQKINVKLADYLESSIGSINEARLQKIGFNVSPEYAGHLRELATLYTEGNIARQFAARESFGSFVKLFDQLETNGFSSSPTASTIEKEFARTMTLIKDGILNHKAISLADYNNINKLAYETAVKLGDYFQTLIKGGNSLAQKYLSATGFDTAQDLVSALREFADTIKPAGPSPLRGLLGKIDISPSAPPGDPGKRYAGSINAMGKMTPDVNTSRTTSITVTQARPTSPELMTV